jgi:hypothetical protein
MTINDSIKCIALNLVGIKEKPGNTGFIDQPGFEEEMRKIGMDDGDAYCCLTCKYVWRGAYKDQPEIVDELDKLFSESCVETLSNFRQSRFKVDRKPEVGAVMIMQKYDKDNDGNCIATWQGHAGIVVDVLEKEIVNVEGNTNSTGGREGDGFYEKKRLLNFNLRKGLIIKAFIHPIIIKL